MKTLYAWSTMLYAQSNKDDDPSFDPAVYTTKITKKRKYNRSTGSFWSTGVPVVFLVNISVL